MSSLRSLRNARQVLVSVCTLAALCVGTNVGWAQESSDLGDQVYTKSVVAADHPAASAAGREMLRQGGNVVDAAVATSFALSVVRPGSSGIGGGGFLLYWDAALQSCHVYDYRESAPARATAAMYAAEVPADQESASQRGALAVAVPGAVAGLCRLHANHGQLSLSQVLAPALRLAREGVPVDPHDLEVQAELLEDFDKHREYRQEYATLWKLYANSGKRWQPGDRFHSPLAAVLERIARDGAAGFHDGEVAEAIAREVRRGGGVLTVDDLRTQQPVRRQALVLKRGDRVIHTMPPPSSGGVALIESLQMLDALDTRLGKLDVGPSAPFFHRLTETFQHAFADRARFLGDADFVPVPVQRLISAGHAADRAGRIEPGKTFPTESYGSQTLPDDHGTSHFSILDVAGNAVACTETINTLFGSYVVEPTFGIVLNNEMDDFTAQPGKPNAFGLIQSPANAVAPGKKPLSSMTPTIVTRAGQAELVVGASGGPRIITATLQVLWRMSEWNETPWQAVTAPRLHHQWLPRRLGVESGFDPNFTRALEAWGHPVETLEEGAVVQTVARTPAGLRGASDPRKHGQPAGD
ncbi:MAG: gamma-glutamyltransferase [Planctomycetaceae bacterium]